MANENLHLGAKGEALIKSYESLALKAYLDYKDAHGNPVYSIGWGHSHVPKGLVIDEAQAEVYFKTDALEKEHILKNIVKVDLNQNQFDALMGTIYNIRVDEFRELVETSGLNKKKYDQVSKTLLNYNKSGGKVLRGLTRRRTEEGVLFDTPV